VRSTDLLNSRSMLDICRSMPAEFARKNAHLVQSNGNGSSNISTNIKIVPRLLSLAAATFVLLAVVRADAQPPATSSVAISPIPRSQARIWIYSGSSPTSPFNYSHVEAVTLNGVTVGYEQLGAVSTAMSRPGITLLPPPATGPPAAYRMVTLRQSSGKPRWIIIPLIISAFSTRKLGPWDSIPACKPTGRACDDKRRKHVPPQRC
jgi:hypothetical protein